MKKELYITTIEPTVDIVIVLPDDLDLSVNFNAKMLLLRILGTAVEEWHEARYYRNGDPRRKEAEEFQQEIGIDGAILIAKVKTKNKEKLLRELEEYFSLKR